MKQPTRPLSIRSGLALSLDRRAVLRRLGLGLAAVPLLYACGEDGGGAGVPDGAAGDPDATAGDPDGAAATADARTGADGASATDWASGGTAAMTDKPTYPDPFSGAISSCVVVGSTTAGPCTTATDLDREDVSEGWAGLPVRLALKVVDASCDPVAGATVKIWATNREGIYSGNTPNPGMCSENNQAYIAANFFRGVQTTDASGVVYFDTCFPGWYNGRAIHIHFQVKSGTTSYRVSQLFFPEDITADIFARHVDYKEFGQPDTTFANDGVARSIANLDALVLTVARMTDGAMLASKVVTVRS